MKKIFDKSFCISFALFAILYSLMLGLSFYQYSIHEWNFNNISFYSFYRYNLVDNEIGQILRMISPIIIIGTTAAVITSDLKTKFFELKMNRITYRKYLKENLKTSYLKCLFLLPLFFIVIFVVSYLAFPTKEICLEPKGMPIYSYFDTYLTKPYLHIILSLIAGYCFSIFSTNIAYIVARYVKKMPLVLIITFIVINLINYLENGLMRPFIAMLFGPYFASQWNVFYMYFPGYWATFFNIGCLITFNLLITFAGLYLSYRSKEKVVLDND